MADTKYYDELAQRARTDEDAFEELYRYFFPRVYNFVFARLKNADDADDVTSIVFIKMNENLERYDPARASFTTWLFRIANNAIVDRTRRQETSQETEWEEFFDPAAPENQEPETNMMSSETSRELLLALDKLNERERRIIELRFWGEMDFHAIAEVLNITEANVRTILHRTLNKLKKILGDV